MGGGKAVPRRRKPSPPTPTQGSIGGGALAVVIVWTVGQLGADMPAEVGAAFAAVAADLGRRVGLD
jgi:hypothetical protein